MQTNDLGGSVGATAGERYLALDSLRGVCAVCVALFHFASIGYIHSSPLVLHSFMFVDFFFVLRGFVICASYGRKLETGFPIGRFMALRLGRLYPLHLLMLLLYLVVAVAQTRLDPSAVHSVADQDKSFAFFIYGLLFIQIFIGSRESWWNPPSWSISAEIWTYLIAAGLFRFGQRRLVPVTLLLIAGAFALNVHGVPGDSAAHHWGALPRCLFSFGLGIVSFRLFGRVRPALSGLSVVAGTLAESAVLLAALLLVIGNYSLIGPFAFAAMVIVFAFQRGWWTRVLLTRPMLLLGTLSYSIYMIHAFLQARYLNALGVIGRSIGAPDFVARFHGDAPGGSRLIADGVTLGMVALVVAAAWCSYRLIERPGQSWSRRRVLGPGRDKPARRAEKTAPTF